MFDVAPIHQDACDAANATDRHRLGASLAAGADETNTVGIVSGHEASRRPGGSFVPGSPASITKSSCPSSPE